VLSIGISSRRGGANKDNSLRGLQSAISAPILNFSNIEDA